MEKTLEQTDARKAHEVEKFGWLTKEEPLASLTADDLDVDFTILESISPFFGYYDDQPKVDKPKYLYFVLDHFYPLEKMTRVLCDLTSFMAHELDVAPGNIFIANEMFYVYRVRNLQHYNQIHQVEDFIEKAGLKLKKGIRRINKQNGIIYLNKFLHLLPVSDGFFMEKENQNRGYFKINRNIDWDEFKYITRQVKFNTSLLFFDAARAAFMEKGKITELVRIYRENLTLQNLHDIREIYQKFI